MPHAGEIGLVFVESRAGENGPFHYVVAMTFGDMEWVARGGGRLRRRERLAQIWEVLRFQLTAALKKTPRTFGARSSDEIERMMAEVELPRTPEVERALALVEGLGPAPLAGHALRTWAWG